MSVDVVGVVGAGVMGTGVTQALAQSGHRVILVDLSSTALERAQAGIRKNLRFYRMLADAGTPLCVDQVLGRISSATGYDALAEAQFVIENVTEKWDVKAEVHARLSEVCPPHVPFAVNTSAISITRIASVTNRPARVVGMHFMNPVPLMPLVEVIRGYHTSEATIECARAVAREMGKDSIVVEDSPGFVTNRVMMLTINEAIFLLQERVSRVEDVDRLFKTCFGHKMGPLETADLIGLDTILYSLDVLYASFNDSKYRPCTLLQKMVAAGLHGRKSGEGFYRYSGERTEAFLR